MLPQTIRTKRLTLRPHRPDDIQAMSRYMADPKFSDDTSASPRTDPEAAAREWLSCAQQLDWRTEPHWGIWLDRQLVGGVDLRIEVSNRRAEIGYEVARAHRNRGIATEAAAAVIESAFAAEPDLNRVFARADARNQPSTRVLRKLGMRYEGTLREHSAKSGTPADEVQYGLLRREFEGSPQAPKGAARGWPRLGLDPIRMFDLRLSDLLHLNTYFVNTFLEDERGNCGLLREFGDRLYAALMPLPDVVDHFSKASPGFRAGLREAEAHPLELSPEELRSTQEAILQRCAWNVGMAKSPATWDALPWGHWDPREIHDRADVRSRVVLDIGAGTGQATLRCAPYAERVFALEPVGVLRKYIERKMSAHGFRNVTTIDGLLERVPLAANAVDVAILTNGSFGWKPDDELREIDRVVRRGGTALMLAPCRPSDSEILDRIRRAGYDAFDLEMPTMGTFPGFIKRYP
ncbi:MAG: GNAT family N-acetyltransferase [Chloroflexota bacterium]|nr:GNAT family N-acetyltransferase [Chloroflexota bacterium]